MSALQAEKFWFGVPRALPWAIESRSFGLKTNRNGNLFGDSAMTGSVQETTATQPLTRRELRFETLDDAVRDAESLLKTGYVSVGQWDLAQVCEHLADWMTFPLDGFPKAPLPLTILMWVMRRTTIGPMIFRDIVSKRQMRAGSSTIPETVHRQSTDPATAERAVGRLRTTVDRFKNWTGAIIPSPLFGSITKEQATVLQCVHCSHHLSFLRPKS